MPKAEIGTTGLNVSTGGYVEEEFLPNLHGRNAILAYKEMSNNDSVVGGVLFAIDMLVRQVKWNVEQGEGTEADAKFIEECMDDMSQSWGDLISEILSMLVYGFSFHEIVYKRRRGYQKPGNKAPTSRFKDGKIGWRKIPIRSQDTLDHWDFDDGGGVAAYIQRSTPTYEDVTIPMEKGLLFRTTTFKNNPEGKSLLRTAYRSWYYKRRVEEIEGVGIERDLAGFPVFKLPAAYLASDAPVEYQAVVSAYKEIGKNIRRDRQEFLMMPSDVDESGRPMFTFELMTSGGARTFDTNGVISRYNQGIAMSMLADFILLGHEGVGSFALSSDKTSLFSVALGTILDAIADVFNRYAIPRLFVLNGMKTENMPELKHGDIETEDLAALGSYISALNTAGMPLFPDDTLEKFVRDQAGMPERSEEAKKAADLAEKANQANGPFGQAGGGSGASPAGGPEATDAQSLATAGGNPTTGADYLRGISEAG